MTGNKEDAAGQVAPDQARPATEETAAGPEADADPSVLRAQLEEEKAKADKYLSNWQRAEADLANFRRRSEQERADLARFGNANLIRKILPVLDDFERAISSIPEDDQSLAWVDGIKLIDRKLRTILEQEGVSNIEAVGREFDPHFHEAVMHEGGEGDTDMVVQELQRGYRLHDRVLRPAMVKVGRGNKKESAGNS